MTYRVEVFSDKGIWSESRGTNKVITPDGREAIRENYTGPVLKFDSIDAAANHALDFVRHFIIVEWRVIDDTGAVVKQEGCWPYFPSKTGL